MLKNYIITIIYQPTQLFLKCWLGVILRHYKELTLSPLLILSLNNHQPETAKWSVPSRIEEIVQPAMNYSVGVAKSKLTDKPSASW